MKLTEEVSEKVFFLELSWFSISTFSIFEKVVPGFDLTYVDYRMCEFIYTYDVLLTYQFCLIPATRQYIRVIIVYTSSIETRRQSLYTEKPLLVVL